MVTSRSLLTNCSKQVRSNNHDYNIMKAAAATGSEPAEPRQVVLPDTG